MYVILNYDPRIVQINTNDQFRSYYLMTNTALYNDGLHCQIYNHKYNECI